MIRKIALLLIFIEIHQIGMAQPSHEVTVPIARSQFQAHLSALDPITLALREVPFENNEKVRDAFLQTYARYLNQITLELTLEPRNGVAPDPKHPLALDIENNGGVWKNWDRNLQRLLFEMDDFIFLKTTHKKEIRPLFVSFQRQFGYGQGATFLIAFPRTVEGLNVVGPLSLHLKEFGQNLGEVDFPPIMMSPMLSSKEVEIRWERYLLGYPLNSAVISLDGMRAQYNKWAPSLIVKYSTFPLLYK